VTTTPQALAPPSIKRQPSAAFQTTKASTPKSKEGKVVNIRATERMLSLLSQLKDEFGINMSESIRNGVALFFIAKQEEKKGRRLVFIDETGKVAAEVHPL
jgi:hypothetical protein